MSNSWIRNFDEKDQKLSRLLNFDLKGSLIWTRLGGNSSYKPPGAYYIAQGPQKQPDILKSQLFIVYKQSKLRFLDLDIGFQTCGAGSRAEILRRIRI